ncbi:fumarylacetoacetase [Sediminicoccus sp. KRV36]|uniref:fumarylacetoacetase n=1 Tax=Sediminicoccus sp. KRV36 TaxID=3133721 RepID=UPI00200E072D|nr:fumarylacetoacetase [Sediminicoccus rosea]UPY37420.1 fumarylacetoacetase [Sediminicoccus rosea]
MLDETHDPKRQSWVLSANGHPDFPIQNLPLGLFTPPGGGVPRAGVAIGDAILELEGEAQDGSLNALLGRGGQARQALRARLSAALAKGSAEQARLTPLLHDASACTLHVPGRIGDYTDFYVGIHHATAAGKLFRPDNPLLPNYKHVPIGYHGRASSIIPSGTAFRRPRGQLARPGGPEFGACEKLDYELEIGIWIGPGNAQGTPIPIAEAAAHIAGFCLLNDWSARDIQAWEYQPLGPFLGKSFATSISPWIVTPEALAPFRIAQPPRPPGDPAPLPYLTDAEDQARGGFDIALEAWLVTPGLAARGLAPHRIADSNARHMYWTVAQMVAHHSSNGCNLNSGDLFGSGTISGPERDGYASLLEATQGGTQPMRLASGEERRFLEDGDEVILRAQARRTGFLSIGFGECRGRVLPAA